ARAPPRVDPRAAGRPPAHDPGPEGLRAALPHAHGRARAGADPRDDGHADRAGARSRPAAGAPRLAEEGRAHRGRGAARTARGLGVGRGAGTSPEARGAIAMPAGGRTMRGALVRNVLPNVVGRGVAILAWFAIAPLVLARLGPARFGFWSLLSTFAATALLMDLGLGSAVTKFVAEYGGEAGAGARRGAFTVGVLIAGALAAVWGLGGLLLRGSLLEFARVPGAWRAEAFTAA